jgi:type VI secretion system secreted protein Hcp
MANVDYFLKLTGIDGESKDAAFPKQIDVQSWTWGETNIPTRSVGAGLSAGKVGMAEFHFTMQTNKASATIAQYCAGGTHIAAAELTCRKAGDTPQVYLKIKFTDVLIVSINTGGSQGEIVPTDNVALAYNKVEYAYGEQGANGKVAALDQKFGYDVRANKKI